VFSLHAQATSGLVKNVAEGTCYTKSYNSSCKLYEVNGSGLTAICIRAFPTEGTYHHGGSVFFDPKSKDEGERAASVAETGEGHDYRSCL